MADGDAVALRFTQAAERLKAQTSQAPPELTADDALVRLRRACDDLRDTDLEVRRARARIAALSVGATVRSARPEAPPEAA